MWLESLGPFFITLKRSLLFKGAFSPGYDFSRLLFLLIPLCTLSSVYSVHVRLHYASMIVCFSSVSVEFVKEAVGFV